MLMWFQIRIQAGSRDATWKSHTHERNMRLNITITPNKTQNLMGYLPKSHQAHKMTPSTNIRANDSRG